MQEFKNLEDISDLDEYTSVDETLPEKDGIYETIVGE